MQSWVDMRMNAAAIHLVLDPDWQDNINPNDVNRPPADDQLVAVFPGILVIHTGTMHGPVRVGLELTDAEPPVTDGEWEEVVEVSFTTSSPVYVSDAFGVVAWDLPEIPGHDDGTSYRLRVNTQGRRAGLEASRFGVAAEAFETILLQVWPAPEEPKRILRAGEPLPI